MTWTINEGNMSDQEQARLAARRCALGRVLFLRSERFITIWGGTCGALIELRVSISQLDGDITEAFLIVADGLKEEEKVRFTTRYALIMKSIRS